MEIGNSVLLQNFSCYVLALKSVKLYLPAILIFVNVEFASFVLLLCKMWRPQTEKPYAIWKSHQIRNDVDGLNKNCSKLDLYLSERISFSKMSQQISTGELPIVCSLRVLKQISCGFWIFAARFFFLSSAVLCVGRVFVISLSSVSSQSIIILHCFIVKNNITKEEVVTIQLSAQTSIASFIPRAKHDMKCPLPKLMMLK